MPVCSFFSCCSSFYFHVGKFKRKKKHQIELPHAIWTIQKSCGSYPPLGRIKVKFLPCFSFLLHLWFLGFFYLWPFFVFTFMTESILHLWLSIFFTFVTFFFTYDVEFLHFGVVFFFIYVAVVTFVTVFTFEVLTCHNRI